MSSIFGVCHFDGHSVGECLNGMNGSLANRGPGPSGIWQDGSTGLGHRPLFAPLDSLDARLPLVDDGKRCVITADARIDNRQELSATLGLERSHDESPARDAELILAAYRRWGEQVPAHLIGDFAFAVWDLERQTLFCARDPMGIRPLYYHRSSRVFAFASAIRAVLACSDVPRRLNEAKVATYLLRDLDDTAATFYQDVFRLPAAHALTVSSRSMRVWRYYSLDDTCELHLGSDGEYADAFREIFTEAVRCRARGSFLVGSMLSGGLDSSSIACTANLVLQDCQRPLRTFSAVFPSLPEAELRRIDERAYVDAVLKSAPFDQSYIYGDQLSPLLERPQVLELFDEACLAPNFYLHWGLYRAAAGKGVRVLLDGIDGDTAVSHGLGYLTELACRGRWLKFLREAKAVARRNPASFDLHSLVKECGIRPLVPDRLTRAWRGLRRRHADDRSELAVLRRSFARRVLPSETDREGPRKDTVALSERQSHRRALNSPLIQYVMDFADAASSALSVEVRYPFFDRRLIEFCLSIPAEQKLRRGWTRSVMRRAMDGVLPAEVRWRTGKANLSPNFARGLYERDRALIEDVVFSRLGSLSEYLDVEAVQDTFRRWSQLSTRNRQDAATLFAVATLAQWMEHSGLQKVVA